MRASFQGALPQSAVGPALGEETTASQPGKISPVRESDRNAGLETLGSMDDVLGLLEMARAARAVDEVTEDWIEEEIRFRNEARSPRDFQTADPIRDALADRGVVLEDSPEGTRWKVVK